MGISVPLIKKSFIELSIDIEKGVEIEMSTGFQSGAAEPSVSIVMPITLDDLDALILNLTNVRSGYKNQKSCSYCNAINPENDTYCNICGSPLQDRCLKPE